MSKRFSVDRPMFGDVGSGQRNYGGQVAKSTAELLDERGHNDDQTSSAEKEMQATAFAAIVALLLEAGYYRARIATLSEFDKAVGGLCWAITTSGVNVDVDILFTENATIGEKVQLSEKVIAVMRAMRCPHPLQANQVQGSDWANVLPTVSWLVAKTVENRALSSQQLRRVAHLQFGKHLAPLPHEDRDPKVDSGLPDVMARYTARRRCRLLAPNGEPSSTEASRVHTVLLEYGETLKSRYGLAGSSGGSAGEGVGAAAGPALTFAGASGGGPGDDKQLSAFERKLAAVAKKAAAAEAELATATSLEEDALLRGMQALDSATWGHANTKRVGSIVGLGTNEIAAAAARYQESVDEARRKVEELGEGGGGLGGAAAHRRQKAALEKRAQQLQPQVASLARAKRDADAHLAAKADALAARTAANAAASARAAALEAQAAAAAGPAGELATLKGLVVLNEQLRSQEQSFKQNVKRQLGNLTAELAALEAKELADASSSDGNGGGGADDARLREIEAMHGKVTAKFARLRQLLAERNVAVSLASRLVDDVPLRAELLQYERRFNELYAQVAGKLAENKKYFAAYNTLDETHRMLAKEVTLINSIADHFDAAMASKATKEAFVAQLAGIIASTDAALGTQRAALAAKDATLEGLQAQHQALVDEQRAYFKAVKDFQAECTKNELYAAKLQEMTSG